MIWWHRNRGYSIKRFGIRPKRDFYVLWMLPFIFSPSTLSIKLWISVVHPRTWPISLESPRITSVSPSTPSAPPTMHPTPKPVHCKTVTARRVYISTAKTPKAIDILHNKPNAVLEIAKIVWKCSCSFHPWHEADKNKTLLKALRTQAFDLFWYVWFGRLGLVSLDWQVWFGMFGSVW